VKEEHRLREFQNKALQKILKPKKAGAENTGKKLLNKELYNLYASCNIVWTIKSRTCVGYTACTQNFDQKTTWKIEVQTEC
jgi:hypothetical protein